MHLNDDQTILLRSMWDQGAPASQIASAIGGGLTRSAVLGRVHRMQLAPRRVDCRASVQTWAKRRRYWDRATGMVRLKPRPGEQHMRAS